MKLIAVTGVATAGKDTFADGLAEIIRDNHPNLRVDRISFANFLKDDLREFILDKFDKDVFNLDSEDKKILRPLLVAYGQAKRAQTKGMHWINLLDHQLSVDPPDVAILSDLRFAEEETDELQWLKSKNGVLVHVERYDMVGDQKVFIEAPNDDERRNDPILKEAANNCISWPTSSSQKNLESLINGFCHEVYYHKINLFL